MEDIGRVPGYEGVHVLRDKAGNLHVEGGLFITKPGEPNWLDDMIDNGR